MNRTNLRQPLSNNKTPTVEELERLLSIDPHHLEQQWQQHPDSFYKIGKQLAYAISERDEAAKELKEVEAIVDAKIRHDAELHDERITEKGVESEKRLDKGVKAAQTKLADLSLRVGLLQALRDAFMHRKDALKDLVQLYLSNYYGNSDIGQTRVSVRDATAQRAKAAMHEARQRSDY